MAIRQRVLKALAHEQPDKVPYNVEFTSDARAKMVEFYGDPDFEAKLGNHFTILPGRPKHTWKEIKPGFWLDDFGTIWDRTKNTDVGVMTNQLITPENVAEFKLPDPDDPVRYEGFTEKIEAGKDTFIIANFSMSLFERAFILAGMENILMGMLADKTFINVLFDRLLEWNLRVIEKFCSFEIDAISFGDDFGQQDGLLIGPQLWGEFIKPRIREMYQATKSKGHYVFIHSCGQICELFDELIECGVDVYNPFQPEVMNVFEVKEKFGDRLSFYGGISTQKTLPFGTVTEVKDEVSRLLEVVGKNGGYIAAPAHKVPTDAKPENIAAMIEVLQSQ